MTMRRSIRLLAALALAALGLPARGLAAQADAPASSSSSPAALLDRVREDPTALPLPPTLPQTSTLPGITSGAVPQ